MPHLQLRQKVDAVAFASLQITRQLCVMAVCKAVNPTN